MADHDIALMAHLMRRAGFGASREELETRAAKGYEATVEELVSPQEEPVEAEPRNYGVFGLSPDGLRVAVEVLDTENPDLWIYDMARDISTRLTFESGAQRFPTWTADGTRIAFGDPLSWKSTDGTGAVEVLA